MTTPLQSPKAPNQVPLLFIDRVVPANPMLISAYETCMSNIDHYARTIPHSLRKFVASDSFADVVDYKGYVAVVEPDAPVCPHLIVNSDFIGCVAGTRVSLENFHQMQQTVDSTTLTQTLEWACPTISVSAQSLSRNVLGADCSVFTTTPLEALTLADMGQSQDVRPWAAAIDPHGFVALYQDTTSTTNGLLVACCRTIPAAIQLQSVIARNPSISYHDVVCSPLYRRVTRLAERNVLRLLARATLALGVNCATTIDTAAVVPTDNPNSTPTVAPTTSQLPSVCVVLDYLEMATKARRLLAQADTMRYLDVFMDDPISHTVNYYNSVFPAAPTMGCGGFISAGSQQSVLDSILWCPSACARYHNDCAYFDGLFVTSDHTQLHVHNNTTSVAQRYKKLCHAGGNAYAIKSPMAGNNW